MNELAVELIAFGGDRFLRPVRVCPFCLSGHICGGHGGACSGVNQRPLAARPAGSVGRHPGLPPDRGRSRSFCHPGVHSLGAVKELPPLLVFFFFPDTIGGLLDVILFSGYDGVL